MIEIKGNQYTPVEPTVHTFLAVKQLKDRVSGGNYGKLLAENSMEASLSLDLIDAIACLSVYLPEMTKDLAKYDSYLKIPLKESMAIVKIYRGEFMAWYSPILKELYGAYGEAIKDEEADSTGELGKN